MGVTVAVLSSGREGQGNFLTSTWERRSQLYLRLRASGSQSGSTNVKPRLMNQCMVRVVSTKMLSKPALRARQYWARQMENFLFGAGAEQPAGYVPPTP